MNAATELQSGRGEAAIANEAELLALQRAPALPDGHQVGQHLAGMGVGRSGR